MIIIGHHFIKVTPFYFIKNTEDIKKTPSNSTVVFEFSEQNLELCHFCKENSVAFALIADSMKDVLFANSLEASFIICDKIHVNKAQKIADEYIFDAKVLLYSSNMDDLEWAADLGIDGIIFEKGIDYGSS